MLEIYGFDFSYRRHSSLATHTQRVSLLRKHTFAWLEKGKSNINFHILSGNWKATFLIQVAHVIDWIEIVFFYGKERFRLNIERSEFKVLWFQWNVSQKKPKKNLKHPGAHTWKLKMNPSIGRAQQHIVCSKETNCKIAGGVCVTSPVMLQKIYHIHTR